MAKAGNYTAYQRLRPIQQRDTLGQAEQQAFRYRAEDDLKKRRKQKEAADWAQKIGTSLSSLRAEATGINSIDEMNAKVLLDAKKRLTDAWKRRKENPNDIDTIMEIANLERLPDDLKTFETQYSNWAANIAKGINEGKLSAGLNQELIKKIDSQVGNLNAVFKLDERGSLVGAMMDPENDDIMEFKTIRNILDGSGLERPIPVADYNASQEAIKKMYTTHTNKNNIKGTEVETVGLRESDIDGIYRNTENVWGTFEEPTDFAKSILADRLNLREDQVTRDLFNKYKTDFADEIIASYTTKNSKDDQWDKRQQRALQWARLNKSGKGKRQDEADFLRTTVDGALAGDPKYVQAITESLVEAGKEEDNPITDAEFTNGKLIVKRKNGGVEEFDSQNRQSVGRLISFIRPDEAPDVRLGLYEMGKVLVDDFQEGTDKGNSKIKINALVDGLAESEDEATEQLNNVLGNKFQSEGNWFSKLFGNKVKGPDGVVYDLDSAASKEKLKDFLMEYNPDQDVESEEDRMARLISEAEQ